MLQLKMYIRDWLTNKTKSATCSPPAGSVYVYMQCCCSWFCLFVRICQYLAAPPFKAELLQASVIYASAIFLLFCPTSLTDPASHYILWHTVKGSLSTVFPLQDVTILLLCGVSVVRTFLTCLAQHIFLCWELLLVLLGSLQLETFLCNQQSSTVSRLSSQGKWQRQSLQQIPQNNMFTFKWQRIMTLVCLKQSQRKAG